MALRVLSGSVDLKQAEGSRVSLIQPVPSGGAELRRGAKLLVSPSPARDKCKKPPPPPSTKPPIAHPHRPHRREALWASSPNNPHW